MLAGVGAFGLGDIHLTMRLRGKGSRQNVYYTQIDKGCDPAKIPPPTEEASRLDRWSATISFTQSFRERIIIYAFVLADAPLKQPDDLSRRDARQRCLANVISFADCSCARADQSGR